MDESTVDSSTKQAQRKYERSDYSRADLSSIASDDPRFGDTIRIDKTGTGRSTELPGKSKVGGRGGSTTGCQILDAVLQVVSTSTVAVVIEITVRVIATLASEHGNYMPHRGVLDCCMIYARSRCGRVFEPADFVPETLVQSRPNVWRHSHARRA